MDRVSQHIHKAWRSLLLCGLFFCGFSSLATAQKLIPPGTIAVDSLFVDATEITNLNWQEYLFYLKKDSGEAAYTRALPDTTVWENIMPEEEAKEQAAHYFRSPENRQKPVVGVSFIQAAQYCQWRTAMVNHLIKTTPGKVLPDSLLGMQQQIKIRYKLPSPEQWTFIALHSISYHTESLHVSAKKAAEVITKKKVKQIRRDLDHKVSKKKLRKDLISFYSENPIYFFENLRIPSHYHFEKALAIGQGPVQVNFSQAGIKFIRGNVTEYTNVFGLAKGSNWTVTPAQSDIYQTFRYNHPSPLIGFRCIAEVSFQNSTK